MNNSKLFVSGICLLVLTLAAPLTSEAQRGGGGRGGGAGGAPFTRRFSGGVSRGGMGAVAAISGECQEAASLVAEWLWAEPVGAVLIGTVAAPGAAAIGAAAIGTAATGAAATGMAEIGAAATGIMAIITTAMM